MRKLIVCGLAALALTAAMAMPTTASAYGRLSLSSAETSAWLKLYDWSEANVGYDEWVSEVELTRSNCYRVTKRIVDCWGEVTFEEEYDYYDDYGYTESTWCLVDIRVKLPRWSYSTRERVTGVDCI